MTMFYFLIGALLSWALGMTIWALKPLLDSWKLDHLNKRRTPDDQA